MRTGDVEAMTSFFREAIGLEAAGEGETVTFRSPPSWATDVCQAARCRSPRSAWMSSSRVYR